MLNVDRKAIVILLGLGIAGYMIYRARKLKAIPPPPTAPTPTPTPTPTPPPPPPPTPPSPSPKAVIAKPSSVTVNVGDTVELDMYAFKSTYYGYPYYGINLYEKPTATPLPNISVTVKAGKLNPFGGETDLVTLGKCTTDNNGFCKIAFMITDWFCKEFPNYNSKGRWLIHPITSFGGNLFANIKDGVFQGMEVMYVRC